MSICLVSPAALRRIRHLEHYNRYLRHVYGLWINTRMYISIGKEQWFITDPNECETKSHMPMICNSSFTFLHLMKDLAIKHVVEHIVLLVLPFFLINLEMYRFPTASNHDDWEVNSHIRKISFSWKPRILFAC